VLLLHLIYATYSVHDTLLITGSDGRFLYSKSKIEIYSQN